MRNERKIQPQRRILAALFSSLLFSQTSVGITDQQMSYLSKLSGFQAAATGAFAMNAAVRFASQNPHNLKSRQAVAKASMLMAAGIAALAQEFKSGNLYNDDLPIAQSALGGMIDVMAGKGEKLEKFFNNPDPSLLPKLPANLPRVFEENAKAQIFGGSERQIVFNEAGLSGNVKGKKVSSSLDTQDILNSDSITSANIKVVRPGNGSGQKSNASLKTFTDELSEEAKALESAREKTALKPKFWRAVPLSLLTTLLSPAAQAESRSSGDCEEAGGGGEAAGQVLSALASQAGMIAMALTQMAASNHAENKETERERMRTEVQRESVEAQKEVAQQGLEAQQAIAEQNSATTQYAVEKKSETDLAKLERQLALIEQKEKFSQQLAAQRETRSERESVQRQQIDLMKYQAERQRDDALASTAFFAAANGNAGAVGNPLTVNSGGAGALASAPAGYPGLPMGGLPSTIPGTVPGGQTAPNLGTTLSAQTNKVATVPATSRALVGRVGGSSLGGIAGPRTAAPNRLLASVPAAPVSTYGAARAIRPMYLGASMGATGEVVSPDLLSYVRLQNRNVLGSTRAFRNRAVPETGYGTDLAEVTASVRQANETLESSYVQYQERVRPQAADPSVVRPASGALVTTPTESSH